jgi:hypothetical protein
VAQGLKRGISVTCVSNIRKTAKTFGKRHLLVGDLGKWAKSNSLFLFTMILYRFNMIIAYLGI